MEMECSRCHAPLPVWQRIAFVFFFATTGLAHRFIDEYYFVQWPTWDTSYVVEPIGATQPASLLIAFLLLLPRHSFEVCAAFVATGLMLISIPAHLYVVMGHMLLNHSPTSPVLCTLYVVLAVPMTLGLVWAVMRSRPNKRGSGP